VYGTIETPYFKGREVASLLGYKSPANAIQRHVQLEDKVTIEKLEGVRNIHASKIDPLTIFINESGLYSLILSSKLPQAKEFKKWITTEVLPSIRKTGKYVVDKPVKKNLVLNIEKEADLQKAVVNYLRRKYPTVYFTASLGELQDTTHKRIKSYQMGYQKGTPDLLIFHKNKLFGGLAIEFKTPKGNGVVSPEQEARLHALKEQKWDVIYVK